MALPEFVEPMLAVLGKPFDSEEHAFELKWDGIRALVLKDGDGVRLLSRRRRDMTFKYPDLAGLADLPDGTALDAEIVCIEDGRPDFQRVLEREQVRSERRAAEMAAERPALLVVFDCLFVGDESVMGEPFTARRRHLDGLVTALGDPRIFPSALVEHDGTAFYERACADGWEGIVAKRLTSPYAAGRRSPNWVKMKRREVAYCVIVGFLSADGDPVRSLHVATDVDGVLTYVGRVGSGLGAEAHERLARELPALEIDAPVLPIGGPGRWVEPRLFCTVSYVERTRDGRLRAPVFEELVDG